MFKKSILKGLSFKSLSHPLLLLIIGALISSYIIPYYTRVWQDHQKELEIKTALVSEISDAVATQLIKTQITKAIISTPYKEFYDAYEEWESANSVIESKLEAYFHETNIPELWRNYKVILSDFAFLSISSDICKRIDYLEEIRNYLSPNDTAMNDIQVDNCTSNLNNTEKIQSSPYRINIDNIDWIELAKYGNQTDLSNSWLLLKKVIIDKKDRLIQEILQSKIEAFS